MGNDDGLSQAEFVGGHGGCLVRLHCTREVVARRHRAFFKDYF